MGKKVNYIHAISIQIRSRKNSVFGHRKSPYSFRIKENTDQKKLRIWTLFTRVLQAKRIKIHASYLTCKVANNRQCL